MKQCSYCGRDNPDEAAHCRECGTEFERTVAPPPLEELTQPESSQPVRSMEASGDMRSMASLETSEASELGALLRKENIPFELRTVTQESGLDLTGILVAESFFERACEVSETWEADRISERARRYSLCPQCRSPNLERNPHDKLESVLRCKNCGYEFSF